MYTIGQFSIMTKISKKTLRYYDEIDLLKPAKIDYENSYRYYDENSLLIAQQILIYRNCNMALEKIKEIINQPMNKNNLKQILETQLEYLNEKMIEIKQSQNILQSIINSLGNKKEESVQELLHDKSTILCIRRRGNHNTIGEIISELFETALKNGLNVIGSHTIIWHTDKDFSEDSVDMEIFVPIESSNDCNLQNIRNINKQKYCEIVHYGSMTTLSSSYAKIFTYIEKKGLRIAGPFEETFKSNRSFVDPQNLEIIVSVPVAGESE